MRVERIDRSAQSQTIAIANSGFVGLEPEILVPLSLARELRLEEYAQPEIYMKILGDGREVEFTRYRQAVEVYVVAEDRVEGPVRASVLVSPRARYTLLNDKLLGALKIVLIDFGEGVWCFRDELGRRERKTY